MNPDKIQKFIEQDRIRKKSPDKALARSLIEAAERNAKAASSVQITITTASMVFNTFYESFKQLGDANWWLLGFETQTHDASIELLKSNVDASFQHLDRFRQIRHDEQYRGFKIIPETAEEIKQFWTDKGKSVLQETKKELV